MTTSITKGRLTLVALVVIFALPALIAKLILAMNWYQPGVTNQGKLVEPSLYVQDFSLELSEDKSWRLVYVMPEQCDDLCAQQLYLLQQSYLSLGKYQQRVQPTVFITKKSDLEALNEYAFIQIQVPEQLMDFFPTQEFVIVDPLGQFVMHYPRLTDRSLLISQSKGLLADFRKLLKLSRVG